MRQVKTIDINGVDFEYEEVALSYDTILPMDRDIAKELLLKVKQISDGNSLKFYLTYGTLLGAVREHNFIEGDEDIDVYVDNELKLMSLIPTLYQHDIKLCRVIKGILYSFMYKNGCYIDFYILKPYRFSIFGLWCFNVAGYATPKKILSGSQKILFLGANFDCPKNPEAALQFWYGKTWRIPCRGHGFHDEIYLSICYKKAKNILKKIIGYKKRTCIK